MEYRIKRAFNYAHAGTHTMRLREGTVCEIRSDLVPSLLAAGIIEEKERPPHANKALDAAPENKQGDRQRYPAATRKRRR